MADAGQAAGVRFLLVCLCPSHPCFPSPPQPLIASVPKRHFEERTQRLYTSALVKSSASNTVFLTSFRPFLSLFSNRYGAMIIVTGFVGKQLVWYVAQSNIKEVHEKQHKEGKTPL